MDYLKNTHDLSLKDWGPYTKKYMGISHVADKKKGLRFDLSVYACLYRRKTEIPNVMWESNFHPWESATDLSHYTYRQELEWKDKLYTDISFTEIEEDSYQISCHFKNNSGKDQNAVLNYMAYINVPIRTWGTLDSLQNNPWFMNPVIPEEALWIDALEYHSLTYAITRATDNLVADGLMRGEKADQEFVNGSGIACGFGKDKGDRVSYKISLKNSLEKGILIIRYRNLQGKKVHFTSEGLYTGDIVFSPSKDFQTLSISLGKKEAGLYELNLISQGGAPLEIDGFVITPLAQVSLVEFAKSRSNPVPDIIPGPVKNSVILKYEGTDRYYGILWKTSDYKVREIYHGELDSFMKFFTHNHVNAVLEGDRKGHYLNVFMRPVFLKKNEEKTIFGNVTVGGIKEVTEKLRAFEAEQGNDLLFEKGRERVFHFSPQKTGEKYLFSQDRMAATTLSNVVYPIYMKNSFIKHNTPGRWWNSLYTWDSGFCGLGLLEMDTKRAIECLNAYVTEPDDEHSAFIHHGSMVPVQFYLFWEIMNRTQETGIAEFFYPRLRSYYEFYCGKKGSSTMGKLKSHILKSWDYFYNSGGWDDYPPQVYVHKMGWEDKVAPVVNTAHAVRIGKMMKAMAERLGRPDEAVEYQNDIDTFSHALMTHSWDEKSGYFGYVCHDGNGNPTGIMTSGEGENSNKGLGGLSPLIAGICSPDMTEKLLDKLFDPDRYFTDIGLTTVDKSASYYSEGGYWNGAVWMPHQWFYWKTMLDLGKPDLAYRIAERGLRVWENEVKESYNCYEHFIVGSGRGAGWHHFGGLSTPVLSWYQAYYGQGRLTAGFDTEIRTLKLNQNNTDLTAELVFNETGRGTALIACMNPDYDYRIIFEKETLSYQEYDRGTLNFILPAGMKRGVLTISVK